MRSNSYFNQSNYLLVYKVVGPVGAPSRSHHCMGANMLNNMVLLYLHIPRTGGTSLRHLFELNLARDQILELYGDRITNAKKVLARVPDQNWDRIKLVRGHFTFGIHEAIPRPCAYFTMLRQPVARAFSLYKYILRDKSHSMHQEVANSPMADFFISGISLEVDNGQIRQLCGSEGPLPQKSYGTTKVPFGKCSRAMLREARDNISKYFIWVGRTENHQDTVDFLCQYMDWNKQAKFWVNTTPQGLVMVEGLRKRVAGMNVLDQRLYDQVRGH